MGRAPRRRRGGCGRPGRQQGAVADRPARRVCPYDPLAGTDPFPLSLIGEDLIDPPFALAGAPCCAIHLAVLPGRNEAGDVPPRRRPRSRPRPHPRPQRRPPPHLPRPRRPDRTCPDRNRAGSNRTHGPARARRAAAPDRWGDYDLSRGDRDGEPRWGGGHPLGDAGDECPAPGTDALRAPAAERPARRPASCSSARPTARFGRATEWAVREFQIYAKMALRRPGGRARPHRAAGLRRPALAGGQHGRLLGPGQRRPQRRDARRPRRSGWPTAGAARWWSRRGRAPPSCTRTCGARTTPGRAPRACSRATGAGTTRCPPA